MAATCMALQNGHRNHAGLAAPLFLQYRAAGAQDHTLGNRCEFLERVDRVSGLDQFDDFYRQAQVKVPGKKPGEWVTRTGQSVTYGITLVKDAPNPDGATRFLEYMLSADCGLKVLEEMGQPPFIPCRVPSQAIQDALPGNLPKLVEVRE